MTYLTKFNQRTRRPVALLLAITVGGLAGLLTGQAKAADIPQTYTPAPAPVVDQRVQSGFSTFSPYVGVRGGFGWLDDTDFGTAAGTINNSYDDWGLTGSAFAGIGTQFFPGFGGRLEAELGYSSFEVERHSIGGTAQPLPTGDTTAFTGMVNAYVDADLGGFRPFAGAGIGLSNVSFNDHGANGAVLMDDDETNFAWQIAGGVGYDLSQQLTLEGMVRYQSIMDVGLTAVDGTSSSIDLNNTSALVGLRYRF